MSDYVAKVPLKIGRVVAHPAGGLVSAERVERFGWQDQVEKVGKSAAPAAAPAPRAAKKTTRRK